jgi:hypothetical protein
MDEVIDVVHLDLSSLDRARLENLCNDALSVLELGEVTLLLASHDIYLMPRVVTERAN